MKDSLIVNLSDREVKRKLMSEIGRLSGPYEILIRQVKRTRSLDANRYYFAAVVTPFCEWLQEEWGDRHIDKEQAHEMLKVKILGVERKKIGDETVTIIPRSKTLSTEEFSDYVDRCVDWLAGFTGIIPAPKELLYERPAPPRSKR